MDEEDPLFDDDWDAAVRLYSTISLTGATTQTQNPEPRPPITLLVTVINNKILFDPSKEELAVADAVVAVSLAITESSQTSGDKAYSLLGIRTIDSPARLTQHGVLDTDNPAITANEANTKRNNPNAKANAAKSTQSKHEGVWTPPVGGMSRSIMGRIVALCISGGATGEGVAAEVFEGLEGFATHN